MRVRVRYVRTVATTRTRRLVQYSSAYNAIELFETLYAILILTAYKLRKYIEK